MEKRGRWKNRVEILPRTHVWIHWLYSASSWSRKSSDNCDEKLVLNTRVRLSILGLMTSWTLEPNSSLFKLACPLVEVISLNLVKSNKVKTSEIKKEINLLLNDINPNCEYINQSLLVYILILRHHYITPMIKWFLHS